MLILGVILRGDLRASCHVHRVLSLCNDSLHALRVLRCHGLSAKSLSTATEATIISRLLCQMSGPTCLVGPDICGGLRSSEVIHEETAVTPVPLAVGRVI